MQPLSLGSVGSVYVSAFPNPCLLPTSRFPISSCMWQAWPWPFCLSASRPILMLLLLNWVRDAVMEGLLMHNEKRRQIESFALLSDAWLASAPAGKSGALFQYRASAWTAVHFPAIAPGLCGLHGCKSSIAGYARRSPRVESMPMPCLHVLSPRPLHSCHVVDECWAQINFVS